MKLNAPTNLFFLISLVLAVLAILAGLGVIGGAISANAFWISVVAWGILAAGCFFKGM